MLARGHLEQPSTPWEWTPIREVLEQLMEPTPAERRLQVALEEVHAAARAIGIDAAEIAERYLPWRTQADLWLLRTSQLVAENWRRIDAALREERSVAQ